MQLKTLKQLGTFTLERKKSTFIAKAFPINSLTEAKEAAKREKVQNKLARHVVWAGVSGDHELESGYSDDGEPGGTGGKGILETMHLMCLTNCAVVVVRFFGGVLLGAGPLKKAYKDASVEAIKEATVVPFENFETFKVFSQLKMANWVEEKIVALGGKINKKTYTDRAEFIVTAPTSTIKTLKFTLKGLIFDEDAN